MFAAFMLLLLGFFHAIKGLAAIVNPDFFADTGTRPAFDVDHGAYGWVHLALGVAIFLAGIGVLSGNAVARVVAVVLAGLSAVATLPDLTVAPVWGRSSSSSPCW